MEKKSFKNIFRKSESSKEKGRGKILTILLLILLIAIGVYLAYPLLFPTKPVVVRVAQNTTTVLVQQQSVKTEDNLPEEKELTKFDIEYEQRELGYEKKVFTYEPYIAPSNRNPFEKIKKYYVSELIAEIEQEDGTETEAGMLPGTATIFRPVLPPGTNLTGIIDSPKKKVAIIEMNNEKYIANLFDILEDRYIVKEIKNNEVIIDFDGSLFSLKIGGEDLSDEL